MGQEFDLANKLDMEKYVGIACYSTSTVGLGGRIKLYPSDFEVNEITGDGRILNADKETSSIRDDLSTSSNKKFTAFTVVKKNLDTIYLAREIARFLHVSYNDVSWAGLKDNRAVTAQEMCVFGDHQDRLLEFKMKNVEIKDIYHRNHQIHVGELWGNHFKIKIRHLGFGNQGNRLDDIHDMTGSEISKIVAKTTEEIQINGFPNFFGLQRFGSYRPNSHLLGKFIFQRKYSEALDEFLISTYPREHENTQKLRNRLSEERDYENALRYFPHSLTYEREVLKALARNPENKKQAIKQIPRPLLKLILSAYQSYLFNRAISQRIELGGKFNESVNGDDIAILVDNSGPTTPLRYKYDTWLNEALDKAFNQNRASIMCPILGTETELAGSPFESIYRKILLQENFQLSQFRCSDIINLDYGGTDRAIYIKPRQLTANLTLSEKLEDSTLNLEFSLPKGTYATMLIREYVKK